MGDLRIETPETTEAFAAMCSEHGMRLPVTLSRQEYGVLVDADGREIINIDIANSMPAEQAEIVAMMVELAVNTCGGFKASRP